MRAVGSQILLAAATCALLACGGDDFVAVERWSFVTAGDDTAVATTVPVDLSDRLREGQSYALEALVPVPAAWRGRALTLAIPRLPAPTSLSVAGQPVEPATAPARAEFRNAAPIRWRIPATLTDAAYLPLRLDAEYTWFQAAWVPSMPRLSPALEGDGWFRFVRTFNRWTNASAAALIALVGLSYLLVFVRNRRRAAYGWFACQGLMASAYPLFELGTARALGRHELYLLALLSGAALASLGYTRQTFGRAGSGRWWRWLLAINIAVWSVGGGPFSVEHGGTVAVVGTVTIIAIYQLQLCVRMIARGHKRSDAIMLLLSWVLLSLFAGLDLLYWSGLAMWLDGLSGAGLGLACFAILQTVTLSWTHERTLLQSEALNRALAQRIGLLEQRDREKEQLTDELRRQVGARSRQLSHALSRLGNQATETGELAPGMIIDDRYRVERRLGSGATAVVYEVERIEDGRRFALKVLRSSADTRVLARFAREAHIAAEVTHDNVVAIHDIDFASGGFMYVVLDLVRGASLKACRDRYGDVPWALDILRQTALGLRAVHDKGVIHRDLKPANILLSSPGGEADERDGTGGRPVVKIADFGVSGLADSQPRLTALPSAPGGSTTEPARLRRATLSKRSGAGPAIRLTDVTANLNVSGPAEDTCPTVPDRPLSPGAGPGAASGLASPGGAPVDDLEAARLAALATDPERTSDTRDSDGVPASSPNVGDVALMTQVGQLLGTPAYMAPELADGEASTGAVRDVYSFGVVAFELLAGRRPSDEVPLLCKLAKAPLPEPASLARVCPAAPAAVAALVDRAVSYEPDDRPGLAALIDALEAACRSASDDDRGGPASAPRPPETAGSVLAAADS